MYPENVLKALQRAHANIRSGNPAAALADLEKIVQKFPHGFDGWLLLGQARGMLNRHAAAEQCFKKATEIQPENSDAWHSLGISFSARGMFQQALPAYSQAINVSANPHPNKLINLGSCLLQLDQYAEAVDVFKKVIARQDTSDAWIFLGISCQGLAQYQEALSAYLKASERGGDSYTLNLNIGTCYDMLHDYANAAKYAEHALKFKPDDYAAFYNLGSAYRNLGQFEDAEKNYRLALKLKPDFTEAHSNLLQVMNYNADHTPAIYLAEARLYGQIVASKVASKFNIWQCEASPNRLRVGMVSGDLREHSVGHFLESLLAQIDPAQIELIAYPTQSEEDALTARIKPRFAAWKPLVGLNDQAAAQLIHGHGVHILIDLSGHTAHNRLPVFAWRPAPVQLTWIGLPTTTGVAEMDYILGDPIAIPVADEGHFSEQVWRLPESYLCLTPPDVALEVSPLPALASSFVTFASFNNLTKMSDATVAVWAKVLQAVPGSRLLLKSKQLQNTGVLAATIQRFAAHGIVEERLILEAWAAQRIDHLAAYQRADIALDTFPYPGVTTSGEALWMGVPVITLQGDRFLSRTAESIAHNVCLADWVASDEEDYVAKAVAHTADLQRLASLRAGLRQQVLASPLFDAPRFARSFEQVLWGMWKKYCA